MLTHVKDPSTPLIIIDLVTTIRNYLLKLRCRYLIQTFIHVTQLIHTMKQIYKQICSHCYEISSCIKLIEKKLNYPANLGGVK
jgi:hypothetical protein